MNNPFAHKGYIEQDGELVKAPNTLPAYETLSTPYSVPVNFAMHQSKDERNLNKTERTYLSHLRRLAPAFLCIQCITLKLADDCRLTPDFAYTDENNRLVLVDVKGFQREDAFIKMKVAARKFPLFDFVIVKKNGLSWATTKVNP